MHVQATTDFNYLNFVKLSEVDSWSTYFLLSRGMLYTKKYPFVQIGDFLTRNKTRIDVQDGMLYKRPTIQMNANGIKLRNEVDGKEIGTKKQFRINAGQFLLSKIDARNGAFGVVPPNLNNAIITGNFWTFDVNYSKINPHYLTLLTGTKEFQKLCQSASVGTTNRNYLQEESFLSFKIPLPNLKEQEAIVNAYQQKIDQAKKLKNEADSLEDEIERYLYSELGISFEKKERSPGLTFIDYSETHEWGIDKLVTKSGFKSDSFQLVSLRDFSSLVIETFRGKSPKYSSTSSKFILNQKCNRWNEIDLDFVKNVDEEWFSKIKPNVFTREGDIIINSTGDGTIGRSSLITQKHEGLLFDSHLLLLRLNLDVFNPKLFVELFNSTFGQTQIEEIKSAQATKQTELGINNLLKIKIPFFNNVEQQEKIVSTIEQMKTQITFNKTHSRSLIHQANQEFEKALFT